MINTNFIKGRLEALSMTQKELGERMGLDESRISYILAGKRPLRTDHLVYMCEALKCEPDDVIIIPGRGPKNRVTTAR